MTEIERLAEAVNRLAAVHEATERRVAARQEGVAEDGQEDKATAFMQGHPAITVENAVAALRAQDIRRTREWARMKKFQLGHPVGRKPKA